MTEIFPSPDIHNAALWAHKRVGLFGGSFNPPHAGHIHVAQTAKTYLGLDVIWWMLTPQNPLKNQKPTSIQERLEHCRALLHHHAPYHIPTNIEEQLGTNLTWQTILELKCYFPKTKFVWITGLDNAHTMHKWYNWKAILETTATAHIARPPARSIVKASPLSLNRKQNHIFLNRPKANALLKPHFSYWIKQTKMINISSSLIRESNS